MDKDDNSRKEKFDLAELFLVAADIHRTFVATRLERQHDNGEKFYIAVVKVHEGEIISASESESGVEKNLDIMCVLKLDYRLHEVQCKMSALPLSILFHN